MPASLKKNIAYIAKQLGFDDCRVAPAQRAPHADRYLQWAEEGQAGEMSWLERNKDRRCDPREILPEAKSVISLALNYYPSHQQKGNRYRIARYAWNDDYHQLIEEKLKEFDLALQEWGGIQRYYVDTGPVLERDFASLAGLGWNGKSTVQIHPKIGAFFFLAEIITSLDLPPDSPFGDHCGKCTRCITACPTNAIIAPQKMDARRCISYFTIEYGGSIPLEFRKSIGDRIYGCDECLEVCPWNRFAKVSREATFHARDSIFSKDLRDFLYLTDESFRELFAKSPIKRIKRERFLRNVCVALGNKGNSKDLTALRKIIAEDPSELIKEHAQWAVEEILLREQRVL